MIPLLYLTTLKPHIQYPLMKQPKHQIKTYIAQQIKNANVPPSTTPPSVLVVPGFADSDNADRGIAASLKTVAATIDQYDTIIIVGAHFPDTCGSSPPSRPLTAWWGDEVETSLGNFDVDVDLRAKFGRSTGQIQQDNITDELVSESSFYDQIFLWTRALFPDKKPKTKVLPLLIHATLRDQVQFSAQVLSDNLFKPAEGGQYGVAGDGKRYLVIIPIQVSQGLELYQNIYIENILLDLTFNNKVQDFEQWLYYLTGNTGATFSKTIASQILVVRLSQLASRAVPHNKPTDPNWEWRMLDYYTTYDSLMDIQKMKDSDYISIDEDQLEKTSKVFTEENDSPKGHYIYYSMSLSLEPPLHQSQTTKGKTAKMPVPVSSPEPFSQGAMNELMIAAQLTMQGKKYNKKEEFQKYKSLLAKPAPFSIRVYVLADHSHEQQIINDMIKKNVFNDPNHIKNLTGCCEERVLFEEKIVNFFPNESVIQSVISNTKKLYQEKLSYSSLRKFEKQLQQKYKELVASGDLPKSKLKELDFNLKQNLIIEIQVFHSWEYTELFKLTEAKGSFITLWDGKTAVCEVPDTRPGVPHIIFFRLTQCSLKAGLEPWDWQRAKVHTYSRTRLTKPVWQFVPKDEL
ncbi:hypothetical protein SS50377_27573 [Spironucleus salmonicida]|uniref:Uncharacterized protein n=1 Tax=Spironucleus salmonicida TaxID=348837 RepID=V6LPX8_9EUKA|nr:hypothetical protein SS50377_27573 [Spironucleus salmonicida]|eukprot:EST46650.1 hypothetical protein SS50377_13453 [Spironucleus salmonicida]